MKHFTLDRIILLLASAAFASSASMRVGDAILPAVANTFSVEPLEAAHIISAATLAYSFFQLCFGPVGDRLGKFRTIAWATTASTLGCALATFADSISTLTIARILTGVTAAAIIPLSMAWIGDQVPFAQRQPILARFMTGQIMGLIAGQVLGGIMADTLGWRWSFAVLSVAYLSIGLLLLRELRGNKGIDRLPEEDSLGFLPTVWLVISRLLGIFKIRWAHVILWTVFCEGFITFSTLALMPTHLHLIFGTPLSHAGLLLACFGVGGFIYIASAKWMVTQWGQPKMVHYGGMSISLALLLLAPEWHWGVAGLSSVLVGLGFYMLHNTLQTHATQMAPAVRGSAVSLFASAFFMGQTAGVSLGSQILNLVGAGTLFTVNALAILLLTMVFAYALRHKAHTTA